MNEYTKIETLYQRDMEGLVCKPRVDMLDRMGRRLIVKIKVCDFCKE